MELSKIILFTFVMYLVSKCSCSMEPVCSKFPYDEALLEKMVRTEFKMEKLQDTFQEIRNNVNNELSTHKENFETLSNALTENISEVAIASEAFVEKVEVKLSEKSELLDVKMGLFEKEINDSLQQELENMKQDVADLAKLVGKLQLTGDKKKPTVAFKAYEVSNTEPSQGETIVFMAELMNEGDAYSTDTGVFTAPLSGLYFFTVQLGTSGGSRVACSIMVDGNEVGRVYTRDVDSFASSGSDAVALVTKGGRVYVETLGMQGRLFQSAYAMNSFSGFLLKDSELP